jgi:hypothetical protein
VGVIKSTYRGGKRVVSGVKNLIAWGVIAALAVVGAVLIEMAISDYLAGEHGLGIALVMILLGLVPLSFPIIVIRERIRDRRLMRWFVENAEGLVEGVEGPGGVIYSLDTVLVRYKANLSLIALSTGFESGFYVHGKMHLLPKTLYTLFTSVFGWWMFDWQLWIENAAAIVNNLRDADVVTVGELFGGGEE